MIHCERGHRRSCSRLWNLMGRFVLGSNKRGAPAQAVIASKGGKLATVVTRTPYVPIDDNSSNPHRIWCFVYAEAMEVWCEQLNTVLRRRWRKRLLRQIENAEDAELCARRTGILRRLALVASLMSFSTFSSTVTERYRTSVIPPPSFGATCTSSPSCPRRWTSRSRWKSFSRISRPER